jgi:hypothetical protein
LGKWTAKYVRTRTSQEYYSNADGDTIYLRKEDRTWDTFTTKNRRRYNILSNRTPLEGQPMTSHMIPVDVQHKEKYSIANMTEKVGNKITHQCVKNWEQHQ